jgi:hypothetical protein
MIDSAKDRDVVLGRTLAETAELNSPEYIAGADASAAVRWACQDAEQTARNRRRFRITVLIIVMVLALTGTAAWLTERMS